MFNTTVTFSKCVIVISMQIYTPVSKGLSPPVIGRLSVLARANCDKVTKQVTVNLDFVGEEAYTHGCYLISLSLSFQ